MENILYGTIETWLLWNLSKENTFATDMTCASSTGMYDMYHVIIFCKYIIHQIVSNNFGILLEKMESCFRCFVKCANKDITESLRYLVG